MQWAKIAGFQLKSDSVEIGAQQVFRINIIWQLKRSVDNICLIGGRNVRKLKTSYCNICDENFAQKADLTKHVESVHKGNKLFKCDFCYVCFANTTSLKWHLARIHEGKNPFHCDTCNATFAQKIHSKAHLAKPH